MGTEYSLLSDKSFTEVDTKSNYESELFNNTYSTVFVTLTLLYIFRRLFKSTTPTINFIKGKLRTIGAWLLEFSIIFYLIFNFLIAFLCQKLEIKRNEIELSRILKKSEILYFKNYKIDLVVVMIFSLKISEILLCSSLFILVPVLTPKNENNDIHNLNNKNYRVSTCLISFLWGIFRIPFIIYCDSYRDFFELEFVVFVSEIFSALEFFLLGFFFLILNIKYKDFKLSTDREKINLLLFMAFSYGISKHIVNLINLPFKLDEIHFCILSSLQFAIEIAIFILASTIYFPYKEEKIKYQNTCIKEMSDTYNNELYTTSNIISIEPYIEFDEPNTRY